MTDIYTRGEDGLLIPHSAAFERMDPADADELRGKTIFFNFFTLVRNAIESVDLKVVPDDPIKVTLKDTIQSEILLLMDYFSQEYQARLVPFTSEYNWVKLPMGSRPYAPKTERQIRKQNLQVIGNSFGPELAQRHYGHGFQSETGNDRVILISHVAADLLRWRRFQHIRLFESHTGAIKGPEKFNNKLNLNQDQRKVIPFNAISMGVFGDKVFYDPMDKGVRKQVFDIGKKANWTPLTTEDRMLFGIKSNAPSLYPLLVALR